MPEQNHQNLRQTLESLDATLADVLKKRLEVVAAMNRSELKDSYEMGVNVLLDQVAQSCERLQATYQKPIDRVLRIACFGVPGSFTHQAMDEYFEGQFFEPTYFNQFEEITEAVSRGDVDYGIVPIENSSTGGITEVYDLLREYDCCIVGERRIKIEQNLLAHPQAKLEDIRRVYSHPQGLRQSKAFFKDYPLMEQIPYFSTSKSAEMVAESRDISMAAVAGKKAAELYGLKVLAANINFSNRNFTRFVVITKETVHIADANKITVVLTVKHEPGSLYKTLGYFYHGGLNLMNLESRPMVDKSWEYFFHIDLMGNLGDPCVKDALEEVQKNCTYLKILGNYRAHEG